MNKRFEKLKNSTLYSKFLPFFMIFILMSVQIGALFIVSERQKLSTYDDEANRNLESCVVDIDNMFENLKRVLISAKLDKEVITARDKPQMTLLEAKQTHLRFLTYKNMIIEIKNIYLYNAAQKKIYSTISSMESLEKFPFGKTREILENGLVATSCVIADKAGFSVDQYGKNIVFRLMMPCDHLSGDVLMVDVDFETMKELLAPFEERFGGKVCIRSSKGEILYGGSGQEEIPPELLSVDLNERQAVRSYYGKKHLVTHKYSRQIDADIFSVIPEENMRVDDFQAHTLTMINLVIISILVLFGVLLMLLRNFRNRAKQNAERLERMQENDIQKSFALKYEPITDCFYYPSLEEIERGKQCILEFAPSVQNFQVALLRMDFDNTEEMPLSLCEKFKMMKQTEEILKKSISALAVYERENYALFLLMDPDYDYVAKCRKAYRDCCESFGAYHRKVTCYVSSEADFVKLNELYSEISNLAEYTFIYNRSMFLDFTVLFQPKKSPEPWVKTGIAGIQNNIMIPSEDLQVQLDGFINGLRDLEPADAKQAVYELYFVVGQCIERIREEGNIDSSFDMRQYLQRLSSLQSLDDARNLFSEVAERLQDQRIGIDSNKYALIVKRTREIIEKQMGDPMLCRSMIADEIGISKAYLGRIFKDVVGITLSDAINDMRIKAAEEQLVSTNRSIKDIIYDVGIMNQSYFTVLFKKKYGLSPSEYREKRSK